MPITLSSNSFSPNSNPTLNGSSRPSPLRKPTSFSLTPRCTALSPILAVKSLKGCIVCSTNDKIVSVEVTRLAPHPKYKCRIRKKKKFQAQDPDNQFKVRDYVQLEKSRPISKTKAFIAAPMPPRNVPKTPEAVPEDLGLPLESQQI
ncbi:30S ribosomal protein S17, chloroplastic-like [Actinidia eriantha]|uniref:30S ribosomal protein S17, chloroplastic-like n=1 Tax=Actinidia eriantha TaxID=165200 RepID=UPI002588C359|nr:30S ribosomal protein S17, chloroplastic-like [Actinidia eriantha]